MKSKIEKNELNVMCHRCGKKLLSIKSIELGGINQSFSVLCNECYLNSQSQPEEYAERIRIKGEIKDLNELATRKVKEVGSARLVKDTPEEWGDKKKTIDKGVDREDTPEEWEGKAKAFDDMHDILKPYHKEAEYYPDTLKRVLEDKEKKTITTFLKDTASYNHFYKGEPRVMENNKGEGYEITVKLLNNKKK